MRERDKNTKKSKNITQRERWIKKCISREREKKERDTKAERQRDRKRETERDRVRLG